MSDAFASVREFPSDEDLVKCNEIATNFVFPHMTALKPLLNGFWVSGKCIPCTASHLLSLLQTPSWQRFSLARRLES